MDIDNEKKLEKLLELASTEPAHRPEFCAVLMESTIYVLGNTGSEAEIDEEVTLKAGSNISIENWQKADGSPVIPFFSSLDVLQKSIETEQSYLAIPLRSLFEMTAGATLFLNPMSDYGKEFIPQEVEQLLTIGLSQNSSQRVVEKETQVLLGQPSEFPARMVDSLIQFFAKNKNVEKGYLALMHDASIDEKPHLIIGIHFSSDIDGLEETMRAAGNVAADSAPEGEEVDLFVVTPGEEGLSEYFISETKAFYDCEWGEKLAASPEPGNA